MLAGLVPSATGTVDLGGTDIAAVPAARRRVGYVPQDAVLFPHLDVWRQVTIGRDCDPALAAYWLTRLGVADLATRKPDQLSGGQRRRVALIRALAREPELLLLDEPFSGLDAPVRDHFRRQLAAVQREAGTTTVLVTHDPADATYLADDVAVIDGGTIIQQGRLDEVRLRPAGQTAAQLLGVRNVMAGEVVGPGEVLVATTTFAVDTGLASVGTPVHLRLSPRGLSVGERGGSVATLVAVADLDTHVECELLLADGTVLIAAVSELPGLRLGESTTVSVDPAAISCWPMSTERAADHR
jgi:molybdate transport system permease protein